MQVYGYLFHDTGFRHLVAVYWLLHSAFCFTILLRTIRYKFFNLTSLIFNLAFPLSDFENQGWFLSSQLPEAKEDGQLSVLYSLAFTLSPLSFLHYLCNSLYHIQHGEAHQ